MLLFLSFLHTRLLSNLTIPGLFMDDNSELLEWPQLKRTITQVSQENIIYHKNICIFFVSTSSKNKYICSFLTVQNCLVLVLLASNKRRRDVEAAVTLDMRRQSPAGTNICCGVEFNFARNTMAKVVFLLVDI